MKKETAAILTMADSVCQGGRQGFLSDLKEVLPSFQFYTTTDVAKILGKSLPCIKNWSSHGLLVPSFKIGDGSVLYSREDIVEFLNKNKNPAKMKG